MAIEIVPDNNSITQPTSDDEQSFEQFAATMPETAQGFLESVVSPSTTERESNIGSSPAEQLGEPPAPRIKRINMSKKMRKAMDKFKGKAANLPIMWFHNQAKEFPEWELDQDEKDMIEDAVSTVFELLDIEIAIEPLSMTLTSIWWVLGYPPLVFLFLFLSKKSMTMDKQKKDEGKP
jgi:hypothetical protein